MLSIEEVNPLSQKPTRWRLRKDVVFVDAYMVNENDYSKEKRFPVEIPYPHLIDNVFDVEEKRNVTLLPDIAAFILRFIVMGVDTVKHLPDIVYSEYDMSMDMVNKEIQAVMQLMERLGYLIPREKTPMPTEDRSILNFQPKAKKYDLNAGVQSIGPTIVGGFH
jgi:hypothetical protein